MILLFLTILFPLTNLSLFPSHLGTALVAQQENKPPTVNPTPTPTPIPRSSVPVVVRQDTPSAAPSKKPWPTPPNPRPFMPGKDGEDDLADFKKALEDYRKDVVEFLQQEDITVEGAGTGIGQVGGPDSASTSSLPVKPSQDLETFRKALESYRVGVEQLRKTGKIEAIDYPVLLGEYFEGIRSYKETMKDIQQVVGGNAP